MAKMQASNAIMLPRWLRSWLEVEAHKFLFEGGGIPLDFAGPKGEPALAAPDSVSWQVFKNPITLFIGGITAVILELAEPRVRSGVWNHTTFRGNPVPRLRRTGLAAMMTVYGPESRARAMIAGVCRMHERVIGVTPSGVPYNANDPELLNWVQATASFGFIEAHRVYARALSNEAVSRYYGEGKIAASLYGAVDSPAPRRSLTRSLRI